MDVPRVATARFLTAIRLLDNSGVVACSTDVCSEGIVLTVDSNLASRSESKSNESMSSSADDVELSNWATTLGASFTQAVLARAVPGVISATTVLSPLF